MATDQTTLDLTGTGMTCISCVHHGTVTLERMSGVTAAEVNQSSGQTSVAHYPDSATAHHPSRRRHPRTHTSMLRPINVATAALILLSAPAVAQNLPTVAELAPGQNCAFVTQANADASAGTANLAHDGSPLPGIAPPDISQGFRGIPRSGQPPLTASQRRILECSYPLVEANAEMPYTLFIPSRYDPARPTPLVVDLHGLNITPLMQILFDGTADFAERHGFIVVAPMGYSLDGWWGSRAGAPVEGAMARPGTGDPYTVGELSEIDAMRVLEMVREKYHVDEDRIYLTGHSMGGAGAYYLGAKYNELWAGVAPIAGAGGIRDRETAERFRSLPMLIMHGELDSIVPAASSRRSVWWLQSVGAPHLYLEAPGMDHEFWIRRGSEHMEKVFLFFDTVSRASNVGFVTDSMLPAPN